MKKFILLASAGIFALLLADAHAYEFKLLSGMSLKGELTDFKDGVFNVKTEFGSVSIEADKLDYIIVEEGDPGPKPYDGKAASSVGFKCVDAKADRPVELILGAERVIPEPPKPLSGMSVPPPAGSWSIPPAPAYPGTFRGNAK